VGQGGIEKLSALEHEKPAIGGMERRVVAEKIRNFALTSFEEMKRISIGFSSIVTPLSPCKRVRVG
jgi:hypothetical protein